MRPKRKRNRRGKINLLNWIGLEIGGASRVKKSDNRIWLPSAGRPEDTMGAFIARARGILLFSSLFSSALFWWRQYNAALRFARITKRKRSGNCSKTLHFKTIYRYQINLRRITRKRRHRSRTGRSGTGRGPRGQNSRTSHSHSYLAEAAKAEPSFVAPCGSWAEARKYKTSH